MKNIVVMTGAGMSAESGLKTFRDDNGLWEGHDVMAVASIEGWYKDPELVLAFYNQRRAQLLTVEPNAGHKAVAQLEKAFEVKVITQNVDDLHERAGSTQVIHLHGELLKACSVVQKAHVHECRTSINLGDTGVDGEQIRPFIVWFGEDVPLLPEAAFEVSQADIILIIGTSMQVYPAASLVEYAKSDCQIYYIDPNPQINYALAQSNQLKVIDKSAGEALPALIEALLTQA
ncbi:NAD-dependent deacylase [Thalassotalea sp. LPB0316]|uniref:SIR2 family NAD-dependent protein deacylase n=1 Tax=Thalassotalea sp. LPB0316 TaxID=2769490 RepID=UPI001867F578|nr:NAD-dependent deacylase [Thalassotalea sp. LPB0316]QOL24656.1 NAD-dependent deacylase [Thalassotalea sp. LPB0316]